MPRGFGQMPVETQSSLMGLLPGSHKVLIELEDANQHPLDKGTVNFVIPEKTAAEKSH
jgi:hypothetical protein